jgi:hypothetical protein
MLIMHFVHPYHTIVTNNEERYCRLDEQTTNNIFTGLKNVMQRHKSSDTCYATDCLDDIFTGSRQILYTTFENQR